MRREERGGEEEEEGEESRGEGRKGKRRGGEELIVSIPPASKSIAASQCQEVIKVCGGEMCLTFDLTDGDMMWGLQIPKCFFVFTVTNLQLELTELRNVLASWIFLQSAFPFRI